MSDNCDLFCFQYYLQMDGRGSYEFNKIESDTEEFGSWINCCLKTVKNKSGGENMW